MYFCTHKSVYPTVFCVVIDINPASSLITDLNTYITSAETVTSATLIVTPARFPRTRAALPPTPATWLSPTVETLLTDPKHQPYWLGRLGSPNQTAQIFF